MNITNIIIDTERTLGKQALLVDVNPVFKYENGRRTDTIEGYRYDTVFPGAGFEKVAVKIPGTQQLDKPQGHANVSFEGLELYIYWRNDGYAVGARANGIHIIKQ